MSYDPSRSYRRPSDHRAPLRQTIRGRIIAFSSAILALLTAVTVYTVIGISRLSQNIDQIFRQNLLMEQLSGSLDASELSLTAYLRTKSSDELREHIRHTTQLANLIGALNQDIVSIDSRLYERMLHGLIRHYISEAEASVSAKRGRNIQSYAQFFESSRETSDEVRLILSRRQAILNSDMLVAYADFNKKLPRVFESNIALVILVSTLAFILLVGFSYRITDPLHRLAEAAYAVGRGDYRVPLDVPKSQDEIGTTASAFVNMQQSIHKAFTELQAKAEVERKLFEEQMVVLRMSHQLKDAELLALQTQINPHFLYNTLSAGMQLALSENADSTADFLENLGAFIRYVLKNPSRMVRVSEEIECAERYVKLLKLRFGDRYEFVLDIDPQSLQLQSPALVLQPLVENAVSHGLKNSDQGGKVLVQTKKAEAILELSVSDTGQGMDQQEQERILREAQEDSTFDGSIGLRNVIRRVNLVTEGQGKVLLQNLDDGGFRVMMQIPLPKENP